AGKRVQGSFELAGGKLRGDPVVQRRDQVAFTQVDVARVVHLVGQGVFLRVAAPVVRFAVGPVPLHPTVAQAALDGSPELVGMAGAMDLVLPTGRAPA